MKRLSVFFITIFLISTFSISMVNAHSGRTNSEGCHAGSKPYHCHRPKRAIPSTKTQKPPKTQKTYTGKGNIHGENFYNEKFCLSVNGRTEVRGHYSYPGGKDYIKIDCLTKSKVYEGGLDKRSSLDSVQQVLFFSHLTNKKPAIVIYDTDGKIGKYEHRIKTIAEKLGIEFIIKSVYARD